MWLWKDVRADLHWYGLILIALLAVKLGASVVTRPKMVPPARQQAVDALTVAAIVPVHNEDPETLRRSLLSILHQSRPVTGVVVVDDASVTDECRALAEALRPEFDVAGIALRVVRFDQNRGKRHGIAQVVAHFPDADLYLGVDSDTVLHVDAVAEGVKPFADPRVRCVTGLVLALNARKNILTRLIDLRYANAFLYERGAYSAVGAVLCACGSLAFYSGDVVREQLGDFLSQEFLGRECTYGDDRRLTNYCLDADGGRGRVVFQASAIAWTLVPERIGHYLRQQVRWNKSFFRESLWVLKWLPLRHPAVWLTAVELTSWLVFTATLLVAMLVAPFLFGWQVWATYLGFIAVLGWVRSVRYLEMGGPHGRSRSQRFIGFALAPLYSVLHMIVLLPLRFWSLCTLRDNAWSTRTGVEVALDTAGVP